MLGRFADFNLGKSLGNGWIAQTLGCYMCWADLAVNQPHRQCKGQGILRLRCGVRNARIKRGGLCKCVDLDLRDIRFDQIMIGHDLPQCINRGMCPTANRIGFDIVFGDRPILAKISPKGCRLWRFDGDGGGSVKSVLRHQNSHCCPCRTRHAASSDWQSRASSGCADRDILRSPMRGAERQLTGLSDAHPMLQRPARSTHPMCGDARPRRNLVRYDKRGQCRAARKVRQVFGKGAQRWYHRASDMPLGGVVAVMGIQIVNLGGSRKGGPDNRGLAPVKHEGRGITGAARRHKPQRMITGHLRRAIPAAPAATPSVSISKVAAICIASLGMLAGPSVNAAISSKVIVLPFLGAYQNL
ncbi:hypothetical protein GQR58_030124 [Nymphon striatum]|nr:hypothetical protein GQR58_030124 [Nymphon striatum]